MSKAVPMLKNIIMGGMFVELEGSVTAYNHTTGDRVEVNMRPR